MLTRVVLPRRHRLTRSAEYRAVVRTGVRCGGRHVVVHVGPSAAQQAPGPSSSAAAPSPTRAGLVVGRSVGSAVTRNRVSRRLRAHLGHRLHGLPEGLDIVVRATPSAAAASWSELTADVDQCLDRALVKVGRRARTATRTGP